MGSDHTNTDSSDSDDFFQYGNYYELLDVDVDASSDEIKSAFRELARKYHPDTSSIPEAESQKRFEELQTAREILQNRETRTAYNELGHETYIERTQSLGERVRASSDDIDALEDDEWETEEPEAIAGQAPPSTQDVQTSAIGEAHKKGETIPRSRQDAFVDSHVDTAESTTSTSSVYQFLSQRNEFDNTSLEYIHHHWRLSWYNRIKYSIAGVIVGVSLIQFGPRVLEAIDVSAIGYTLTTVSFIAMVIFIFSLVSLKSTLIREIRFPKGGFMADKNLDRFNLASAHETIQRGMVFLSISVILILSSLWASETHPFANIVDIFRGQSEMFIWFDLHLAGIDVYIHALDIVVAAIFLLTLVIGVVYIAVGISIAAWIHRFQHGHHIRPTVWETCIVILSLSIAFSIFAHVPPVDIIGELSVFAFLLLPVAFNLRFRVTNALQAYSPSSNQAN